ncbi:MAG: tyrosine-type recombinase/integrase [Acidobacteriota bacterium]
MKPTDFARALSTYLSMYLPGQKNVSPHTVHSYRDTFKLLLAYCQQVRGLVIERLSLRDIDDQLVLGFLEWLETDRHNSLATRNQRLACIHAFYRYLQGQDPAGLWPYQKILALPMKKTPHPMIQHLTADAMQLILAQPDRETRNGRRDATLLSVLYDTGARVQELVDLQVRDVRLTPPPVLTLTGKGNKTRQVPLMSATTALLKQYLAEWQLTRNGGQDGPVFFNRQREKMTRAGVAFILSKYVAQAREVSAGIPERVTPHVLRHTKAMHLLQAGVNLVYIRDLLGHADIATTEIYARADTELKRQALEQAYPTMISDELPDWTSDSALLTWLAQL